MASNLSQYCGQTSTGIGFCGQTPAALWGQNIVVAPSGPVWLPLKTTDFADPTLVPQYNPSANLNAPITVNDATGDVAFDVNDNDNWTIRPDLGLFWRLNWPTGWLGDGTQCLLVRMTPRSVGATINVACSIGLCDRDGIPQPATLDCIGHGLTATAANTWTNILVYSGGASTQGVNTLVYPAGAPVALHTIAAFGRIGNMANPPGWQQGIWVGTSQLFGPTMANCVDLLPGPNLSVYVNGGVCPFLNVGFRGMHIGVNAAFTMRFEWCLATVSPVGEYPV